MELQFDGMSSDDEDLPKISFGSFSQSQVCTKREPAAGGTGPSNNGSDIQSRPSDPRLSSNCSRRPKSRRQASNGEASGGAARNGRERNKSNVGGGPIRHRGKRSVRAGLNGNSVYNVKFEIRSKTVKNFLGSATDATGDESDEDGDDDGQQHSQAENGGSVAALSD